MEVNYINKLFAPHLGTEVAAPTGSHASQMSYSAVRHPDPGWTLAGSVHEKAPFRGRGGWGRLLCLGLEELVKAWVSSATVGAAGVWCLFEELCFHVCNPEHEASHYPSWPFLFVSL